MKNIDLTKEQEVLFNLIGHGLFSAPLEISQNTDWSAVFRESIAQSVPLLAFKDLRDIPELSEQMKNYLNKCMVANINCFRAHKYLHDIMTKNQIPYTIIKGPASARYYPEPLLRNMGDVDFYVAPEHLEAARKVFIDDGFEFDDSEHGFHYGMNKGNMHLELHYAPIAAPKNEIGKIFLEYWSDICDKASLTQDVFSAYVLPSDFHHGFILLTHLKSHLISIGIGLRHVCDWAVFANSFSNEAFVETFEARLKRVGLWRFAQVISLAAVSFFGMPHKPWMGEDYETARALIEDIARSGNFGRRVKDRGFESLFVSDYKSNNVVGKSRIARAFRSVNALVASRWKMAKKCPLLYPVGWVYFTARYLIRAMLGKRTLNLSENYKQSGKRIKLYDSLNFFKPEV